MKQNNSRELLGYSKFEIYNENGPPQTPKPQIRNFLVFSRNSDRKLPNNDYVPLKTLKPIKRIQLPKSSSIMIVSKTFIECQGIPIHGS